MQRLFPIGLPQFSLNILPPEFNRQGILLTISIMKEKHENNQFGKECKDFSFSESLGLVVILFVLFISVFDNPII